MGRIRTIKPEFHTHEELSELPPETHLLAAALLNYADDEGYFNANPVLVKAGTNPLRSDRTAVAGQLKQLEGIGYIKIARKGNKHIGLVVEFEKHQRVSHATPSKLKSVYEELQRNSGEPPEALRPEQGIELKGTGNRELKGNREAPTADADGAVTFPLTAGNKHIVTDADISSWEQAYPAVDVRLELKRALVWLEAHPEKTSATVNGSKQRIVKWLGRSQDSGGTRGSTKAPSATKFDRSQASTDRVVADILANHLDSPALSGGGSIEAGPRR